ncbi:MAG: phenylalanine--tRNA ligase subunit beta [Cyanobacteria bacterium SIG30]|nr:phenylalanine--tRNA ligase subunit beta [Cyanobacteria bacterium SIG30]
MQVSHEWLNEFVDLSDISKEEVAHMLTMSGLEVEDVEIKRVNFTNIITAKIIKIDNHPNADKLHLVTIDTGSSTKTVVCGAQNIEEGQIIPYASVGSKVFSRKTGEIFELTPAVIRGVESQGMLCSADELGLDGVQEEDGILILNRIYDNLKLGEKLEDVMNLKDEIIYHTAPTANRGDEMSVIGIARELSSLFNRKMNFSPLECVQDLNKNNFKVEILADDACKYYSIGVIKDIVIKPSPDFIQRRLISSGMRPINNIVDITNYVMLEYGTPLHAFDFDKLNNYLCVRYAQNGEKLTTIDDVERTLTEQTVLIATKEQGVCLAGVFGGNNSEIDDNTKNLALEAAFFTSHTNRKSARSVGYRSEASARFERGVDIEMVKPALLRAMDLIVRFADGKIEEIAETGNPKNQDIEVTLRNSEIRRIMGIDIPQEKSIEILENLGFKLLGKNELAAKFKIPSYRVNDVYREIDLIEEITRIYGFDKIEPAIPNLDEGASVSKDERILKKINDLFLGSGFDEIMTSSLVGNNLYNSFLMNLNEDNAVKVLNPKSEDTTTLRQNLMANLLNVVKYNFDNGNKKFRLYEIGKTYFVQSEATEENSGVKESRCLSGCIFGSVNNEIWNKKIPVDFYNLKGVLENMFEILGLSNRIVYSDIKTEDKYDFLHPAQSAKIQMLGKNLINLGYIGKLHPVLNDKMKLNQDLFVFEINLEPIFNGVNSSIVKYKKVPQFGFVERDIAFIVNKERTYAEIEKVIKKAADKSIYKNAQIFDIYQGENISQDKKSVAIRITLQDNEATLKDEVIDNQIKNIKSAIEKTFAETELR